MIDFIRLLDCRRIDPYWELVGKEKDGGEP